MIIGTDVNNNVLLIVMGNDDTAMPAEFNGTALTRHLLDAEQEAAWLALPSERAGTIFSGGVLSEIAAIPAVVPDPSGFAQAVKAGVGGIVAANALATAYPLFFAAVQSQQWADVQALILDAQAKGVLNSSQYASFQAAAEQFHIPVTL